MTLHIKSLKFGYCGGWKNMIIGCFLLKTHFQHIFNLKHKKKKHSINLVKQIHNLKKQNKPL
jgi:hypothetical protein